MIYITGDTHGERARFCVDAAWGAGDHIIICGDFGFLFRGDEREQEFLDLLAQKPYTVCFCDGNHENFTCLYAYPEEVWNGGRVHRIRKNILHLMRGQVFTVEGRRIFTMGGAYSIDRYLRSPGISYWAQELPSAEEYREAAKNLAACGNEVDIIITHTAPREIIRRLGKEPDAHDMELTGFLEWVLYEVRFGHWYFGHWHLDRAITDRITAVYYEVLS